jgi:transposase InsO family protein
MVRFLEFCPEVFVSHRNARLNVRGRQLLVERVCEQGWAVAHAAKAQGVSRQCAHRWINRFREEREGGRQMGSTGVKKRARIGYDYVHSMVDHHSRLAYSELLPNETGPTCAAFLLRAAEYFAAHGIGRIERVITDNHWSYRRSTDFREAVDSLDAKHKFIKPHCPWQNGKVERFNRTLQVEWAYRQVFLSNADRAAALAPWLEVYNTRRRHTALGGLPPISRLSPTS